MGGDGELNQYDNNTDQKNLLNAGGGFEFAIDRKDSVCDDAILKQKESNKAIGKSVRFINEEPDDQDDGMDFEEH